MTATLKYQEANNHIAASLNFTWYKPTVGNFMQGEIQPTQSVIELNLKKTHKILKFQFFGVFCFSSFQVFGSISPSMGQV